jgi:sugar O-acyltransferase (sialic acid O-acetyltransferase NeuD family)
MRDIVFIGVSNMLSDFIDCAMALGHRVAGIVMHQAETVRPRTLGVVERLAGLELDVPLIPVEDFSPAADTLFALGITATGRDGLVALCRQRWALRFATLVHPGARISPFAVIGEGVFVGAGSVIAPSARLGAFVFVNRGVTVGHDSRIGDYARLMPGCNIGGHVTLGRGVTIGMGANIIEELEIGVGAIVAAGAVVTADVAPLTLVAGVPATLRKHLKT